jgi:NAD-dependent SIR2 family protein deacetylase
MLIVAGTSLKVFPAASIVKSANKMPRLVINRSTSLLSSHLVSSRLVLPWQAVCLVLQGAGGQERGIRPGR